MPAKTDHPLFDQPSSPDKTLWRYMDFSKFADLILNSAIFFARADLLGDPYEGSLPYLQKSGSNKSILKKARDNPKELSDKEKRALESIDISKRQRKNTFISCWHLNQYESAAMWKQYTTSNDSIAITTTYGELVNQLPENVYLGMVRYINYRSSDVIGVENIMKPFVYKRLSFAHEKEVRALISRSSNRNAQYYKSKTDNNVGEKVKIDVSKLIEKIYISPYAEDWVSNVVQAFCDKVGMDFTVHKSELNTEPIW